jgi:type IV secretion system protein TrbG
MRRWPTIASMALMLGGCAVKQTPVPPAPRSASPSIAESVAPPPSAAAILAVQTPEVREAVRRHKASGKWPTYRTSAYVLYPFGEGPEPVVDCAALRTTDLQLQVGEAVTDLAVGDQERWMATPASSGDPRNPVPHIALKPQAERIATNLTVYTTRHIYHLLLRSGGRPLQEVEFYYPDELLQAMRDADTGATQGKSATTLNPGANGGVSTVGVAAVDPSQLNFAYTISGPNVPFRPLRAFDDGTHVYIQMARGMNTSTAPALLIAAAGGTQMVNYRLVDGDYFVVDRLFDEAMLVAGVGREQDRVTITYAGAGR